MKTSRYTEAQILAILRQAEGGVPVAALCREHGSTAGQNLIRGIKFPDERPGIHQWQAADMGRETRGYHPAYPTRSTPASSHSPPLVRGQWRGPISSATTAFAIGLEPMAHSMAHSGMNGWTNTSSKASRRPKTSPHNGSGLTPTTARTWVSTASHPPRNGKWPHEFYECTPPKMAGLPDK